MSQVNDNFDFKTPKLADRRAAKYSGGTTIAYANVADAYANIPSAYRSKYLECIVLENGNPVTYWFRDNTSTLVRKSQFYGTNIQIIRGDGSIGTLSQSNGLTKADVYDSLTGITNTDFALGGTLSADVAWIGNKNIKQQDGNLGIGTDATDSRLKIGNTAYNTAIYAITSKELSNTAGNYGIEGIYELIGANNGINNGNVHSGGQPNGGTLGLLQVNNVANRTIVDGVGYTGVLGTMRGLTNATVSGGVLSAIAAAIILSGTGTYSDVAGLHVTAPTSSSSAFNGLLSRYSGIVIEDFSSFGVSATGVITARYGIRQKGTTPLNIFNGATEFTKGIKMLSRAGDVTTNDIPTGYWGVWKDTGSGDVRLWVNDGGVIKKSIALT